MDGVQSRRRTKHVETKSKNSPGDWGIQGIGAGIALELASAGASVVVNYASDKNGAESIVRSIQGGAVKRSQLKVT